MGIPSLFRVLVRENPRLFHSKPPVCDILYIDFNCLIHHASRFVVGGSDDTTNDEDVITQVVSYTRKLINDIVKPSDLLYIAMDGPVPYAKMMRQRERRFKNKNGGSTNNTKQFDSTKITPGTTFMDKLSQRIKSVISLNIFSCVKDIIFSDSSVPGEGEWKIFQHMRSPDVSEKARVCVYGLDADLVVWSLASNRIAHTILCRENEEGVIMFFELFESLHTTLQTKYGLNVSDKGVLLDIVLILMLGGNDFVCPVEYLKIRNNGWEHLLECYVRFGRRLVNPVGSQVDWTTFHDFCRYVSTFEDTLSKKMYTRQLCAANRDFDTNDVDHIPFASLKHPMYKLYGKQSIGIPYFEKHDIWKPAYYERIFGHQFTIPGFMPNVCKDYLASIMWCWEYYNTRSIPSWTFVYEHVAPPCLTDFVTWYPRVFHEAVRLCFQPGGTCLRPIEQLLCVVPLPASERLLPAVIRMSLNVPENPLFDFQAPVECLLEPITGQKLIYAPPLIPRIDVSKVVHFVSLVEAFFTVQEKNRNTLSTTPVSCTTTK
jgi:5'-3' exonuclease